jgi:leader peptidase (prepilin peptidase)/N-methyltransferase
MSAAPAWSPWAVIAAVALAAGWIAAVDARTRRLPNRLVGPFGAASALLVIVVAIASRSWAPIWWALAAAALAGVLYLAMGLAGWVGLGDVKFAAALALPVAAVAGGAALWLTPVAVACSGVWLLVRRIGGDASRRQAHGPALAAGAVLLMGAGVLWPV